MLPLAGWRLVFAGALHTASAQPWPGRRLSVVASLPVGQHRVCPPGYAGCGGKAHTAMLRASASAASASASASPTVEQHTVSPRKSGRRNAGGRRRKIGELRRDSTRPDRSRASPKWSPKGGSRRRWWLQKKQVEESKGARSRSKGGHKEARKMRGREINRTKPEPCAEALTYQEWSGNPRPGPRICVGTLLSSDLLAPGA